MDFKNAYDYALNAQEINPNIISALSGKKAKVEPLTITENGIYDGRNHKISKNQVEQVILDTAKGTIFDSFEMNTYEIEVPILITSEGLVDYDKIKKFIVDTKMEITGKISGEVGEISTDMLLEMVSQDIIAPSSGITVLPGAVSLWDIAVLIWDSKSFIEATQFPIKFNSGVLVLCEGGMGNQIILRMEVERIVDLPSPLDGYNPITVNIPDTSVKDLIDGVVSYPGVYTGKDFARSVEKKIYYPEKMESLGEYVIDTSNQCGFSGVYTKIAELPQNFDLETAFGNWTNESEYYVKLKDGTISNSCGLSHGIREAEQIGLLGWTPSGVVHSYYILYIVNTSRDFDVMDNVCSSGIYCLKEKISEIDSVYGPYPADFGKYLNKIEVRTPSVVDSYELIYNYGTDISAGIHPSEDKVVDEFFEIKEFIYSNYGSDQELQEFWNSCTSPKFQVYNSDGTLMGLYYKFPLPVIHNFYNVICQSCLYYSERDNYHWLYNQFSQGVDLNIYYSISSSYEQNQFNVLKDNLEGVAGLPYYLENGVKKALPRGTYVKENTRYFYTIEKRDCVKKILKKDLRMS